MYFCPKCEAQINDGAVFCSACGSTVGTGIGSVQTLSPTLSYANSFSAGAGAAPDLKTRVINILTKPKEEWPVINFESTSVASLCRNYIAILAAIPIVAGFIKMALLGITAFGITGRVGIISGLISAIVNYVLSLIGVYVAALVIEKLAPTFQSQGDTVQALKLVAYAYTAAWIAGVLNLLPYFGALIVFAGAIYSIYLFYLGLPVLMKTPQDKVVGYMIAAAVVVLVIHIVIALIAGAIPGVSYMASRVVS